MAFSLFSQLHVMRQKITSIDAQVMNVGNGNKTASSKGVMDDSPKLVGLGMRLEINRSPKRLGVIVREITPGLAVDRSGKIAIGDVIE